MQNTSGLDVETITRRMERDTYNSEPPNLLEEIERENYLQREETFGYLNPIAKDFYTGAVLQESSITTALKKVTEISGGELSGLEYRIKTPESFARKASNEVSEYMLLHPNTGYEEAYKYATSRMYDTVRYTMLAEPDNFFDTYYQTVYNLEKSGYTVSRVKNSLSNIYSSYRGVNTVITTPDGFHFEVQFHTPESLEVKNKTHILYEEARKTGTSTERKLELERQMQALTQNLVTPKDVDKILPFDTLKGR